MPPKGAKKTAVAEAPVAAAPVAEASDEPQQVIVPGANEWDAPRIFIKPKEQLQLTEKDLGNEITKVLQAQNPDAPHNIIQFSHKERVYKATAQVDQTRIHYGQDGLLMHSSSDDAKKQKEQENAELDAMAKDTELRQKEGEGAGEDDARGLRNQFNFSERASQTLNNGLRERGTMTEPPPSVEYSAQCTQWEIFDGYMEDMERKKEAERKAKKKKDDPPEPEVAEKKDLGADVIHSDACMHACKIIERMVNQNTYDDITQDYKFWEDASDQYREGEGTLLPLWKFFNDKAKRKHVTTVKWNPEYSDLFAVGYGSYEFMKQGGGMLCLYSLKNPSYPEFTCATDTGVMCVDWHPQHSSVLCVGLYDGTVSVYDVRSKKQAPIFHSTVKTGKHTDPVWEVCWQEEDLAKNLNFFSISSDGRVTLWTLAKSELEYSDIMQLKLTAKTASDEGDDDASLCGLAGGCCFDFSRLSEHLFLVGTEEGRIHKCSKAYNSAYLETYEGHYMAVYTVRWNAFNPKIFLSCSADWTVKLWEHTRKLPLMSFDLNTQVGDVAWTPWSSTTFAACTADGKVHVFDLAENKNEAMCEQKVVRKAKLTRLAFNPDPANPVILVGDDHSAISCLKLSPNLRYTAVSKAIAEEKAKAEAEANAATGPRRGAAPKKADDGEEAKDPRTVEIEKSERILQMALKNIIDDH